MARRIRVRRSAAGRGRVPPARAAPGRRRRSAMRTQPGSLTAGGATWRTGANAQWDLGPVRVRRLPAAGVAPGRPDLDPAPERRDGGLGELASWAASSVLRGCGHGLDQQALVGLARHDGRAAVAPLEVASRLSSRRPDDCFSGPWHFRHDSTRTGRTAVSKKSTAGVAASRTGLVAQPTVRPGTGRAGRSSTRTPEATSPTRPIGGHSWRYTPSRLVAAGSGWEGLGGRCMRGGDESRRRIQPHHP